MGLSQALSTAISGLKANQAALALVSSNVANAETPGYTRKTVTQIQTVAGGAASVRVTGVNRELDQYIQRQVLTENSGASYASTRSDALQRLQDIYGDPTSDGTLESSYNDLTNALQALSTSPDSAAARTSVITTAQSLTSQLNATSQGIQALRADAESSINSAVNSANVALQQIARINTQLLGVSGDDAASASLLDQRDQYVSQLSQLMDVRVVDNGNNQIGVFTNSGVQLVGSDAATLSFNAQGTVTPNTQWNSDPSKSTLGSITLTFPHGGGSVDLVSTGAIRSGTIAGYLDLRDNTLVQAQAQIDQLAASMASALSDKTTAGTAVSSGAQNGFSLDLSGLQNGNSLKFSYTDTTTGATHNVTVVRVDDPSALPLKNTFTTDPSDEVIGVDFSGGAAGVAAQLNTAFAAQNIQFANPSGSTLQVTDDGTGAATINSASTTVTMTSLTSGNPQLPLFTDNGVPYTGAIGANGSQQVGLAGRISVNAQLVGDPSRLIVYNTSPLTSSGDTTRSDFILSQLTTGTYSFSPDTGLGSTGTPFKGTIQNFLQQFTTMQGQQASAAQQLSDGQNVVLSTLQNKLNQNSGVNIDDEMAHLLALQNAYSANARVMSTVNDMFTALLQSV
ncbi:MAG: flagellar hook-associated protein FlgK [Bradyrhizobiaceae bacterium]|nr:MAG: flagellar hook-associated protein FlgK [Bradyrhizobiaceae bacterium]